MENAYQPELWRDLYVMLGSSTAALLGLLLVVTSLHLDEVAKNPSFRLRSRNNTFFLLALFIEAILILTPQPMAVLGAELAAINLLGLLFHLSNIYKFTYKKTEMVGRGGFSRYRGLTFLVSDLLGVAGGIFLIGLSHWGMYLITASYGTLFVIVAVNAWQIMLGVGQTEAKTKASSTELKR